jgi:hypothetical protein
MLNTGELNAKGLMNFNSIKDIITWQKLNYDFNYHHQEFHTDIRILTLSQTKSILPVIYYLIFLLIYKYIFNKYLNI